MGVYFAVQCIHAVVLSALLTPARFQQNLVRNGEFREMLGSHPVAWAAYGNAQHVDQTLDVVREGATYAARLNCRRIEGQGGDIHAMIAQTGYVQLIAGRLYELSCRAKEEGLSGHAVSVAITDTSDWENCGLQRDMSLSPQWKTFRFLFRATRDVHTSSRLQFWFTEPGTLYLANVTLREAPEQGVAFTDVVLPTRSRNLVPNGAFTIGPWGWTSAGIPAGWGHIAHLHGRVFASRDPMHPYFLRIALGPGITPVLGFDYPRAASVVQKRLLAANLGWIPVQPGRSYTLSCDVRASVPNTPVMLGWECSDPSRGPWDRVREATHVRAGLNWSRYTFTGVPNRPYLYVTIGPDLPVDARVDVDLARVQLEEGAQATGYEPHDVIEGALEAQAPAGLYVQGHPNSVLLRIHNNAPALIHERVSVAAEDYFGKGTTLCTFTASIPGHSGFVRRVPLPRDWSGYYRLKAIGPWGARDLRVAILPREASRGTVFGVNHAFADAFLIRLAGKAGIDWYRDWSLNWNGIEPAPGDYTFTDAEKEIGRILQAGCHVICLLPPFPSADWNSEAPPSPHFGAPPERARSAYAPKDPALLARFVTNTVRHFTPRVRVWEFLNEPVYTDYALPARAPRTQGTPYTVKDYADLLRIAAAAYRQGDDRCTVVGGIASGPAHLTQEEMAAGVDRVVDVLNLHIYPGTRLPEGYISEMSRLADLMARSGGRKPVWITEFGYYGADDLGRRPFIPDPHNFPEPILLENERECSDYTVRFASIMLASGVKKIFLHAGSSGAPNSPSLECPLFASQGSPRKLLPALAVFNSMVPPDARPGPLRRFGNAGWCVEFARGERSVFVVWSPERPVKVPALPPGARMFDIMGRERHGWVMAGSSPLYIIGARHRMRAWAAAYLRNP